MSKYYFLILFFCANLIANNFSFKDYLSNPNQNDGKNIFKPGDGVYVNTFPDTNSFLNRVFPIDDRGYAEFPIVGKVNVSQMTTQEVVDFIKKTYQQYLFYPNVYVKPVVRISLLGGFARPGLYYVDLNSSLWDAVYQAGGTIREDGIYEMQWEREGDEKTSDITPIFERGVSLRAMGFRSGDQIWTPSPDARTFFDTIRDILPLLSFTTTIWVLYNTYQRDTILFRRTR